MKKKLNIFYDNESHGSMMVELLLSVALAMIAVPFIFKYQQNTIVRAENITVTKQMGIVQSALERYISYNREALMKTVGKSITRISMLDLVNFGVDESIANSDSEKYQLRILKSFDSNNHATLQGVIVYSSPEITPMRTRQLVELGENMGFVDGTHTYGTFGTWHADNVDYGISGDNGVVKKTSVKRDNALYLWRVASDNVEDATMLSALNLGEHDILNIKFFDSVAGTFDTILKAGVSASENVTFANRTTIDFPFTAKTATVSGMLSSDSRNLEVSNKLTMNDIGRFSSFVADDLYVSNLTLNGFSIADSDTEIASMRVNGKLDMTYGRITAMYVTVGFAGSITPKLVVKSKIQDSVNPDYYWDASSSVAHFADLSVPDLNTMARRIVDSEVMTNSIADKTFSSVATNNNATVGDFLKAISDIETRVRAKYQMLNLE